MIVTFVFFILTVIKNILFEDDSNIEGSL